MQRFIGLIKKINYFNLAQSVRHGIAWFGSYFGEFLEFSPFFRRTHSYVKYVVLKSQRGLNGPMKPVWILISLTKKLRLRICIFCFCLLFSFRDSEFGLQHVTEFCHNFSIFVCLQHTHTQEFSFAHMLGDAYGIASHCRQCDPFAMCHSFVFSHQFFVLTTLARIPKFDPIFGLINWQRGRIAICCWLWYKSTYLTFISFGAEKSRVLNYMILICCCLLTNQSINSGRFETFSND